MVQHGQRQGLALLSVVFQEVRETLPCNAMCKTSAVAAFRLKLSEAPRQGRHATEETYCGAVELLRGNLKSNCSKGDNAECILSLCHLPTGMGRNGAHCRAPLKAGHSAKRNAERG